MYHQQQSYTDSFLVKTCFYKTFLSMFLATFDISRTWQIDRENIDCFWKYIQIKDNVTVDTFHNLESEEIEALYKF